MHDLSRIKFDKPENLPFTQYIEGECVSSDAARVLIKDQELHGYAFERPEYLTFYADERYNISYQNGVIKTARRVYFKEEIQDCRTVHDTYSKPTLCAEYRGSDGERVFFKDSDGIGYLFAYKFHTQIGIGDKCKLYFKEGRLDDVMSLTGYDCDSALKSASIAQENSQHSKKSDRDLPPR